MCRLHLLSRDMRGRRRCQSGPFVVGASGGTIDARINVVRGRSETDVWAAGDLERGRSISTARRGSSRPRRSGYRSLRCRCANREVAIARCTSSTRADFGRCRRRPVVGPLTSTIGTCGIPGREHDIDVDARRRRRSWTWCATRSEDALVEMRTSGLWRLRTTPPGTFERRRGCSGNMPVHVRVRK